MVRLSRALTDDAILIGDPHATGFGAAGSKDADRSDYVIAKRDGFNIVRANAGARIERKHRWSMVNALLCDATGQRRLYLAADEHNKPSATKLAESLGHLLYGPSGEPETHGKGTKGGEDLTHTPDALGYLLYGWEKFRGVPGPSRTPDERPAQGATWGLRRSRIL